KKKKKKRKTAKKMADNLKKQRQNAKCLKECLYEPKVVIGVLCGGLCGLIGAYCLPCTCPMVFLCVAVGFFIGGLIERLRFESDIFESIKKFSQEQKLYECKEDSPNGQTFDIKKMDATTFAEALKTVIKGAKVSIQRKEENQVNDSDEAKQQELAQFLKRFQNKEILTHFISKLDGFVKSCEEINKSIDKFVLSFYFMLQKKKNVNPKQIVEISRFFKKKKKQLKLQRTEPKEIDGMSVSMQECKCN
ncbi:hypothetical protein RFI_27177, partial [Reticulomyxa filosa]